jgi:hypothetical protein
MIGEALLPDQELVVELSLAAERESAFYLFGLLQRNFRCRCDDQVKVVRHDDELMQKKPLFPPIVSQDIQEQPGHCFAAKNGTSSVCD